MSKVEQVKDRLLEMVLDGELSKDEVVEIIQLLGGGIGLMSINEFAKQHKMSYQGVLKSPKARIIIIRSTRFAIEA